MPSGISVVCFSASYAIALGLEIIGITLRFGKLRLLTITAVVAGLVAHAGYLAKRVAEVPNAPLASAHDWYILVAWTLALAYLFVVFRSRLSALGLFILPLSLALIGAGLVASQESIAASKASRIWSIAHSGLLLVATVTVCIGFLAGLMYLVQSYRLKRALPPISGFQLPSLEWLEQVNSRCLSISAWLVALGLLSGIVLSKMKHFEEADYVLWSDPVVLSLGAMFLWLVIAEIFRQVYPAARQGRKVAYLTLAAFVFLVLVLSSLAMLDTVHSSQDSVGTILLQMSFMEECA